MAKNDPITMARTVSGDGASSPWHTSSPFSARKASTLPGPTFGAVVSGTLLLTSSSFSAPPSAIDSGTEMNSPSLSSAAP